MFREMVSIEVHYADGDISTIEVKFGNGRHKTFMSKNEAFQLADFINALRLTPHQPDAAITPAGGGSEPTAAQVMFNG